MPKSITFILPRFLTDQIGGAELQVYYLAKELINRGWDVSYIRETSTSDRSVSLFEGIKLYNLPLRKRHYLQFLNYFHLKEIMRKIRSDIWYCRVSKYYLPSVIRHASSLGGKIVWAFSSDGNLSFKPHSTHPFGRIMESLEHQFFMRGVNHADLILAQHEGQSKFLKDNLGIDSQILTNGHPLPIFRSRLRENSVVWVSNIKPVKQPEVFLEICRKCLDKPIKFVMVGDIQDVNYRDLLAQETAILTNLKYLGKQPVDFVNEVICKSKVLVNTSEYEGFPNTFIQAWMRGTPVVSLNVDPGGVIEKERLGKVSFTEDQMLEDIISFIANESAWFETSNRVRRFSTQYFNIDRHTQNFIQLLEDRLV
jgi:glycosyltransferase involved in cell wall biosynthesis